MRLIMANRIIVFDIGGTLMEFDGMPLNWSEYYPLGFKRLAESLGYSIADGEILRSAEILRSYNPRFHEREKEIKPEFIFTECLKGWNCNYEVQKAANLFFEGLELKPRIYGGAIKLIAQLKKKGCTVGLYTDLPCGMPDEYFKKCITQLTDEADFYISSQSCGYRKPYGQILLNTAKRYNTQIKDLIYIGDEEKDRQTALHNGCRFLLHKGAVNDFSELYLKCVGG